jgi:hypothetical protein
MKRILCYLRGTPDFGLLLHRSSSSDLVIYTDVDWAGCPDTRRSTSGYVVFLGAEYRSVANGVAEATWLRQLLHELQASPSRCTLIYCDNINVVYLSTNPVQHQRMKHMEIDLHFI